MTWYAVYAGSEKLDLGPKGEPQCLCKSVQQAEHMKTFWSPYGYYERVTMEATITLQWKPTS